MIHVGSIVIRVDDLPAPDRVLDGGPRLRALPGSADGDDFVLLRPKNGIGPNISLDRVRSDGPDPAAHPPRPVHGRSGRRGQAARSALGATEVHWDKRPPDADYVILADPEGNRFCLVDITL